MNQSFKIISILMIAILSSVFFIKNNHPSFFQKLEENVENKNPSSKKICKFDPNSVQESNIKLNIPKACSTPETASFPFCNPCLQMIERIQDLVERLTIDEKPLLLTARESPNGNISRLGIPEFDWGANCMHGVESRCGSNFTKCPTSFPNPNALGASWNQTIWKNMGSIIGLELRSLWLQGVGENHDSNLPHLGLDCWSPNVNLVRDPRWGRNVETPSEDPLINGIYGAQYSIGLQQGQDPKYLQAVTTLKHFDAYSLEGNYNTNGNFNETGPVTRESFDAIVSMYDLYSSYFPAFKQSIEEGKAMGVMCSYNAVNGVPTCANDFLLNQTLRQSWNFQGYVTSDSGAIHDIFASNRHNYTNNNLSQAVADALNAGCDVDSAIWPPNHPWDTNSSYIRYAKQAVEQGILPESILDKAVFNALKIRFMLGLFDPVEDSSYWNISADVVRSEAHVNQAIEATMQSLVLLKNDNNTLPFSKQLKTAVIGPLATDQQTLLGNYLGQMCPLDQGFSCVTSPLQAIQQLIGEELVLYAQGLDSVTSTNTSQFQEAVQTACLADQVILILGLDSSVEREGLDRQYLNLPGSQEQLALQIIQQCQKPLVLVLMNGGVIAIDNLVGPASAILESFYSGFFGSQAIAASLFGDNNRFGKMPVTIYKENYINEVQMIDFAMGPHTNSMGRTYRYYTGDPLFHFGYGLSYTQFELSLVSNNSQNFSVNVTNVGSREGDDVVQVYFVPKSVPQTEPASQIKIQLSKFQRVSLLSGQSILLNFLMNDSDFTLFDSNGKETIYSGQYQIVVTDQGVEDQNPIFLNYQVASSQKK